MATLARVGDGGVTTGRPSASLPSSPTDPANLTAEEESPWHPTKR